MGEWSGRVELSLALIGRSHCIWETQGTAVGGEVEAFGGAQLSRGVSGRGACSWIIGYKRGNEGIEREKGKEKKRDSP